MVYAELRHMAAALLQLERGGHTLQPTALVHELYLRLDGARGVDWQCRGQFFAISAKVMRRILVDHARKRTTAKRASDLLTLDGEALMVPAPDVLLVDAALSRLATDYPRQAAVVELRFFGGLTAEETVEALNSSGEEEVSLRTVQRDWRFSRAWLQDAL